jgi:hypothetical protein
MKPYVVSFEMSEERYKRNAIAGTSDDLFAVGEGLSIADVDEVCVITILALV